MVRGLSLIELMVALAVAGILMSGAVVSASHLIAHHRASAAINQMIGAVQFARHCAVTYRTTTTLCPANGNRCGRRNTWHNGAIVFLDRNVNGRIDGDDFILRRLPRLRPGQRIYWRSFRNRSYLSIRPSGLTDWQNGHLLYCPPTRDPIYAREVIINAQARIRHARDTDGDGIVEDARGRPVVCP